MPKRVQPFMRVAPLLILLLTSFVSADAPTTLPLAVHAASDVTDAQIDAWVNEANQYFEPGGVRFERVETHRIADDRLVLDNNRDRHRFKRQLRERRINVFVVDTIHDPWPSAATRRAAAREGFEPSGRLGGAHIVAEGHRPRTYVIVRRGQMPLVLAHELGHVLGAPHHPDPTNIMSYGRNRTHFSEEQLTLFNQRARRLVRRRDVR